MNSDVEGIRDAEHDVLAFMDFPNDLAIVRLVGALPMKQNDEYTIQKRCVSLESLAPMGDNPSLRLSTIPALA